MCTGNSCRSQMAEGYLRHYGQGQVEAYSAGIEAHGVNPKAIQVMSEDGVDISSHTSNKAEDFDHLDFDYVITVCDNAYEQCPYYPQSTKKFHFNFPDPAKAKGSDEEVMDQFRSVRDQIRSYMRNFLRSELKVG